MSAKPLAELLEFWRQAVRDYFHTGAIAPSSRFLAEAMLRVLPENHPPRRILEVGPGTGPFTRAIAARLLPGDTLTICEINDDFADRIEKWRGTLSPAHRAQVSVVRGDILEHKDVGYHHILCGLPFNNFPSALVGDMFEHFQRLSLPQGTFSYFEYIGVRRLRTSLPGPWNENLREVDRLIAGYVQHAQIEEVWVLRNIPPARVRHFLAAALEPPTRPSRYALAPY